MLELKKIQKSYTTGEFTQQALKGIDLSFRKNEFVAVLGPSGSGKTTLLNIIGGLDRYDSGDLVINHKSTKKFKDSDWDAYRNNCVGFIFQSYNLIPHISVLSNIEMALTLSGVSRKERTKRSLEALTRVGLADHVHKKPNQLSGGQMQRVAIARALVNDPDIILADEPTGALDSVTSNQIMELIQEIAKDKLVIMVTHNQDLAKEYATRVIKLKDGAILEDSHPVTKEEKDEEDFTIRHTAMNFLTALNLSFHNIITKKGRTLLTAFAASIGIIGIALILSLSNGFHIQVEKFERDTLSSMPIAISEQAIQMDEETMAKLETDQDDRKEYPKEEEVYVQKSFHEKMMHQNNITKDLIDTIEALDPSWVSGLSYYRATSFSLLGTKNGVYRPLAMDSLNFAVIPRKLDEQSTRGVVEDNYDLLAGKIATEKEELLLLVDSKNRVSEKLLEALGFDTEDQEAITFEDLLKVELKLVVNDDYYQQVGSLFTLNRDFASLAEKENTLTLKIVGIARGKEEEKMMTGSSSGLAYSEELVDYVIEHNQNSKIVTAQKEASYNVLTGEQFDLETTEGKKAKDNLLAYLGVDAIPVAIQIYPKDFDTKDEILAYLDKYNETIENKEEKIVYTDYAKMVSSLSGNIMDAITIVLIAFSAISLVVSSIMIGVITYISVLERTKEIGVLRALGARKKDISRVFNAETFLVGVASGLIGIGIARLLVIPTNQIIEGLTDLPNVARMNPWHALLLLGVSVLLTVIGGYIPAKMASKKDPVEALRSE